MYGILQVHTIHVYILHIHVKKILKITGKSQESALYNTPIESNVVNLMFTGITFTTERHMPAFPNSNLTRIDGPHENREGRMWLLL